MGSVGSGSDRETEMGMESYTDESNIRLERTNVVQICLLTTSMRNVCLMDTDA